MNISQEDYSVLKQPIQNRYIKLYILDFDYQILNEVSGNLTSMSVNINTSSDIRRTCSIELVVNNSSFDIQAGGQIWLDKYIQPYVGTYDIRTGEIIWSNQGIYLINTPSFTYNADNNTLSIQGVDLVAKLTGARNGNLEGLPHIIAQGENVREAIIETLALAGFNKYIVSECTNRDGSIQDVPYDLETAVGGTVWDILTNLRDILPQYQMYFDVDGVFHYELIPTGENLPSMIDDDLFSYILTSEQITTDFESVKNYIEVLGKTHEVEYYSDSSVTTINENIISPTFASLTSLSDGVMIGMTLPDNISSVTSEGAIVEGTVLRLKNIGSVSNKVLSFSSGQASVDDKALILKGIEGNIYISTFGEEHLIVDENGKGIEKLDKDTYYVFYYQEDETTPENSTWLFMGHLQAQAIWADYNPDSPFYINGSTGIIRKVLTSGEYDNIQTDYLALERAKAEIYWNCRLNDSIVLTTIPIPWIDVNILISHAIRGGDKIEQWIIDSISVDYSESGEMNITAHKYYPYYPSF